MAAEIPTSAIRMAVSLNFCIATIAEFAGSIAKVLIGHETSSSQAGANCAKHLGGIGLTIRGDQMRYVLAAIFVCAIGMPAASALPTVSPNSVSVSKADPLVQVVRRNRPHSHRQSRSGDGIRHRHSRSGDGIHPLVGSGDY
jgi:hypothetical protein